MHTYDYLRQNVENRNDFTYPVIHTREDQTPVMNLTKFVRREEDGVREEGGRWLVCKGRAESRVPL